MSIIAGIGSMLASSGITGIVSGAIGAYTKLQEKKIDNALTEKQWLFEVEMMKGNHLHEKYLAQHKLLIRKEVGADDNLRAAINADMQEAIGALSMKGMPWQVGAARTLFRPWLTTWTWVGLLIILFVIVFVDIPEEVFTASVGEIVIIEIIVSAFAHGAMSSTGFWFGSRAVGSTPTR